MALLNVPFFQTNPLHAACRVTLAASSGEQRRRSMRAARGATRRRQTSRSGGESGEEVAHAVVEGACLGLVQEALAEVLEDAEDDEITERDKIANNHTEEDVSHHYGSLGRVCPQEQVSDPLAEVRNVLEAVLDGYGKVPDLLNPADDAELALVVKHLL
eukprot:CAMPEP_0197573832 /NCGR_PEP_ID=MMETSP1320-20131121/43164_1 /TAXON_ID=91990 /ORGANISM="Bolidomonas sp., Strain RCC2347" /LENGTH=158 /DNA_ID=CAMNT_0043136347 /DNA_START=286 /DNA_END=764 /DNA_ORIENTATION=-